MTRRPHAGTAAIHRAVVHRASRIALDPCTIRAAFDDEVRRGHLVSPFPRAYCRPWNADDLETRERAALVSVGAPAALSHLSALRRWALPAGAQDDLVHITVPIARHPIGRLPGLVVHRTRVPTPVTTVRGLPTVSPAAAIVRSWPLLRGSDQRAPAITAVRNRLVTPAALRTVNDRAVGMRGRARLGALIGQLEAGCESELELWGYLHVFDAPGLRHGVRQLVVHAGRRTFRLDLAFEEEQVAFELDGRQYHSAPQQWERDIRRDATLATIGWQTVRFSHSRLRGDPVGCRRDALDVLAARRAWRRSR